GGRHLRERHVLALPARSPVLGDGGDHPAGKGRGLDLLHGRPGRAHEMSTLARQDPREVVRSGVRRVLWTTLGLNVLVSASKIVVGHLAGSLSLVADGYHSLIDGSNNVIGLV